MNPLDAFILGLVQGVTEFLPISSDGHLALAENLLGLRGTGGLSGIFLDVSVHVATLAAIVIAFRAPILALARGLLAGERRAWADLGLYAAASVPAAIVGFAVKDTIEVLYRSLPFIGVAFIVMGGILWAARGTTKSPPMGTMRATATKLPTAAKVVPVTAIARNTG